MVTLRPFLSFLLGIALACTLLLTGLPNLADAATQQECWDAWQDSSARDSCYANSVTASGTDQCTLESPVCENAAGVQVSNSDLTLDYDDVDDLNNCNGVLTNGSCS